MANFTAYQSPARVPSATPSNPSGFEKSAGYLRSVGALVASAATGDDTDTQPGSSQPLDAHTGVPAEKYGFLDFYNDLHISAAVIDMGNLTSVQVRPLSLFNAYFVPHYLNAITPTNAGGITLTGPAVPLLFLPLQEYIYEFAASPAGPPDIDASYLFDFDVADFTVEVTGTRVIAFTWSPSWTAPVVERLEWLTDVLPAKNRKEQRRALRQTPRWSYRFNFMEHGEERAKLENAIYSWGARLWAMPVWTDGTVLTAAATLGATVLMVDTTTRDFQPGGLALVYGANGTTETLLIASLTSTQLTLDAPTLAAYPERTVIYPARLARLQVQQPYTRHTADCISGEAVFTVADGGARTALSETSYRGYPVVTERFNWLENPIMDQGRSVEIFDYGVQQPLWVDESGIPEFLKTYLWTSLSRAESDTMRQWFYARRGRLAGCWCPTWARDLELVVTAGAADTALDVSHRNLAQHVDAGVNRRDIRIELHSGTVFYRRITGMTELDDTTERMIIDTALGQIVTVADVRLISFMALCRLDSDGVEIAWRNQEVANAIVNLRSFNSDA